MSEEFPADVKQFIGQHIDSIAQLEVLLFLRRESARTLSTQDVAKALYISPQMAGSLLADLARRGFFLAANECYQYQVADQAVDQLIERLAKIYQERRVAVTAEIYSKPPSTAQSFADAFRLRREE